MLGARISAGAIKVKLLILPNINHLLCWFLTSDELLQSFFLPPYKSVIARDLLAIEKLQHTFRHSMPLILETIQDTTNSSIFIDSRQMNKFSDLKR